MGPTLKEEIVRFLNDHREMGYTSAEIVRGIWPNLTFLPINDPNVARVEKALRSLVSAQLVEGRISETGTVNAYYFSVPSDQRKANRLPYQV